MGVTDSGAVTKKTSVTFGVLMAVTAMLVTVTVFAIRDRTALAEQISEARSTATTALETARAVQETAQAALSTAQAALDLSRGQATEMRNMVIMLGEIKQTLGRLEGRMERTH